MTVSFSQLVNFITSNDLAPRPWAGRSYVAHCSRVYIRMRSWGGSDDLSNAAFCQNIYGTHLVQQPMLPLSKRREVKALIGLYAERLVYISCMMDRACFYEKLRSTQDSYHIKHRLDDEILVVNRAEYNDIALINLANFYEENALHNGWQSRAEIYRQIANRLGDGRTGIASNVLAHQPVSNQQEVEHIEQYAQAANR